MKIITLVLVAALTVACGADVGPNGPIGPSEEMGGASGSIGGAAGASSTGGVSGSTGGSAGASTSTGGASGGSTGGSAGASSTGGAGGSTLAPLSADCTVSAECQSAYCHPVTHTCVNKPSTGTGGAGGSSATPSSNGALCDTGSTCSSGICCFLGDPALSNAARSKSVCVGNTSVCDMTKPISLNPSR